MAALCNGIAAYGGFIPFASTFLNFVGMSAALDWLLCALSQRRANTVRIRYWGDPPFRPVALPRHLRHDPR